MSPQFVRQRLNERGKSVRTYKQRVKREPQVGVVSGLQQEVSMARR
jgi:hypothetical protein